MIQCFFHWKYIPSFCFKSCMNTFTTIFENIEYSVFVLFVISDFKIYSVWLKYVLFTLKYERSVNY